MVGQWSLGHRPYTVPLGIVFSNPGPIFFFKVHSWPVTNLGISHLSELSSVSFQTLLYARGTITSSIQPDFVSNRSLCLFRSLNKWQWCILLTDTMVCYFLFWVKGSPSSVHWLRLYFDKKRSLEVYIYLYILLEWLVAVDPCVVCWLGFFDKVSR